MTTRECDKDSNIGMIINSAVRADVRMVKVKEISLELANADQEDENEFC